MIAYGNQAESYREYKLGRGQDRLRKPERPRIAGTEQGFRPDFLAPPAWARAPQVELIFPDFPEAGAVPKVKRTIDVRIDVSEEDKPRLLAALLSGGTGRIAAAAIGATGRRRPGRTAAIPGRQTGCLRDHRWRAPDLSRRSDRGLPIPCGGVGLSRASGLESTDRWVGLCPLYLQGRRGAVHHQADRWRSGCNHPPHRADRHPGFPGGRAGRAPTGLYLLAHRHALPRPGQCDPTALDPGPRHWEGKAIAIIERRRYPSPLVPGRWPDRLLVEPHRPLRALDHRQHGDPFAPDYRWSGRQDLAGLVPGRFAHPLYPHPEGPLRPLPGPH